MGFTRRIALGFSGNPRDGVLEDDSEADDLDVGRIFALSLDLDFWFSLPSASPARLGCRPTAFVLTPTSLM